MRHYSGRDPNSSSGKEAFTVAWRVARIVLVAYILVTIGAHFYSQLVIFQPRYGSRLETAGMLRIPQPEGGSLVAIYLPNSTARHTIWYFHGNAEDLGDVAPFLERLRSSGYAVFAFDYPGYGRSTGSPSEASVYSATQVASRYLQDDLHVRLSQVVVYGRSLGSGPATELAAKEPVAGLVLESAFTSAYRVMTRWPLLFFDKFRNQHKLPRVSCPVLVMHGERDGVIPFAHGPALYASVRGRKAALWVPDAGHNNFVVAAGSRYWEELRKFTNSL